MANPTVNVVITATSRVAATLQAIQREVAEAGANIKQTMAGAFSPQGGNQSGGLMSKLFGDVKGIVPQLAVVGQAIDGVKKIFAEAQAVGQSFYDNLIRPNVELQQQLLATKATLVATNQVLQGGIQIKDPTAAIKALGAPVDAALADIRQGSLDLVGVTSQQLIPIFQNIAGQSAAIGATLKQSGDLTLTFAAALGTLNIPLNQQRQEVSSILQGQIDQNSALAKALNITNDQVRQYKAQGVLVERLTERLGAFRAGNKLAAQTIEGIGSNIAELFDLIKLDVGAPFLDPVVKGLDQVYQFLLRNRDEIQTFIATVANSLFTVGTTAIDVGKSIANLFGGEAGFKAGLETIQTFASGASNVIVGLGDIANSVIDNVAKNPGFQLFAKAVEIGVDGIKKVGEAAGEVTGATGAFNDALATLAPGTEAAQNKAAKLAKTLKDLGDQEKINGSLSAEQKQQRLEAGKAAAIQTGELDDQISVYKDLAKQYPAQREGIEATVKSLEALKAQLSDVKLKSLPVPEKGTALDQITKELTNFQDVLKKGVGDPALFEAAGKGAVSSVQALRQEGAITAKQAVAELQSIVNATNLPKEAILSARKELIKQLGEVEKQRLEELKVGEQQEAELVTTGLVAEQDGVEALSGAKIQQLDLELKTAESVHAQKLKFIQDELDANAKKYDADIKAAEAALNAAKESSNPDKVDIAQRERELKTLQAVRSGLEGKANEERLVADREFDNQRQQNETERLKNAAETSKKRADAEIKDIDREIAANKVKEAEIAAAAEAGNLGEEESVKQLSALKEQSLDDELKKAHVTHDEKIRFLQEELAAQLAKLDVEIASAQTAAEKAQQDPNASGDDIEAKLKAVETLTAKRASLEKGAAKATEDAEEDLANKSKETEAKKLQNVIDTQRKIVAARLTVIDRKEAQAEDEIAKSRLDRELQLDQQFRDGAISRERIRATENKGKLDDIQAEIAANRAKVAELEKLPKSNNPQDEEKRENLIRDARRKTTELTIKLIEEELQQRRAAIDEQLLQQRNLLTAQEAPLKRQSDLSDLYVKSLETQQRLLAAKGELLRSINDLQQGEYSLAIKLAGAQDVRRQRELDRRDAELKFLTATTDEEAEQARAGLERLDNEERQRQLQLEAAKAKQAALERSQAFELESAELEERKTLALQRQAELKLKIEALDAKIATADAAGEVAKLKTDKNATQGQIDAAQQKLDASREKEAVIQDEQKLIPEQRAAAEQEAANKRQSILNKQQLERDEAAGAIAELDPSGRSAQQQSFAAQQRAREQTPKLQRFDSPANVIAPTGLGVQQAGAIVQVGGSPQQEALLEQIRDGIAAMQGKDGTPKSATINNYFSGNADKAAVQDASQQTLSTLKRVLNLAGATGS